MAARIAEAMRDAAYLASVEIAKDKGSFPRLDAEQYLAAPRFASRLPDDIKAAIRTHGIRNSHVLSIAPDRHDFARVRRQRVERHRARLQLVLPAQEAHARRDR